MQIFVQFNETCIHSERSEEEYGGWSEDWDFSVDGVSLSSRDRYNEEFFDIDVDLKEGDTVSVLYMIYGTGDTFGYATGRGEVLWVFKDPNVAQEALVKWETENNKRDPDFSVKFKDDSGREVMLINPGAGYFENVSSIDLKTFTVNP